MIAFTFDWHLTTVAKVLIVKKNLSDSILKY